MTLLDVSELEMGVSLKGNFLTSIAILVSAFPMGRLDLGLGTTIQFVPPVGQDTLVKYGVTHNINTKNQCITAMEAYKDKSLEVLYYLSYII